MPAYRSLSRMRSYMGTMEQKSDLLECDSNIISLAAAAVTNVSTLDGYCYFMAYIKIPVKYRRSGFNCEYLLKLMRIASFSTFRD